MKIEVPIEEKPTPPKPNRKYRYKASVEYSSDRPKLMKLLWSLDDQAIMEARSNWRFKMISVIRGIASGQMDFIYLIVYLGATAFVVFCTLPLHEFAHAFAAYKSGDQTPKMQGRITLNPLKHIDPIGVMFCLFFG